MAQIRQSRPDSGLGFPTVDTGEVGGQGLEAVLRQHQRLQLRQRLAKEATRSRGQPMQPTELRKTYHVRPSKSEVHPHVLELEPLTTRSGGRDSRRFCAAISFCSFGNACVRHASLSALVPGNLGRRMYGYLEKEIQTPRARGRSTKSVHTLSIPARSGGRDSRRFCASICFCSFGNACIGVPRS